MKKSQKILSGVIITSMLSASAFGILALDLKGPQNLFQTVQAEAAESNTEQNRAFYNSFTGTVTMINPVYDINGNTIAGKKLVLVENKDGLQVNFSVNEDTYWFNADDVKIGDSLTGFYEADKPVIMIYPPQYQANVLAVNLKDQELKADIFDKNLLSADKQLKLNISKDTKIIDKSGNAYTGKITSEKLLVVYRFTTKSLPPQTSPEKIVVLDPTKSNITNVSSMDIVVNNEVISSPAAFSNKDKTVMVPIRAISEALGYKVTWDKSNKSVRLNNSISLSVGKDYYVLGKMAPITLGSAPISLKGKVYVPLSFFKEVVGVTTADSINGQIVIYNK